MPCLSAFDRASGLAYLALDAGPMAFAEPGVGPTYTPSREVAIEHLGVVLRIDPVAHSLTGEARLRIRPFPGFTGTASFDLDDVTVDEVVDTDGQPLAWSHGERLRVQGLRGPTTVVVRWHGTESRRGLYFTGPTASQPDRQHMAWTQCQDEDAHYLLPCHDHPRIRHPWSIRVEAPVGYTLLSNGERKGQGVDGDVTWAEFEQADPMPAYLFSVVVAKLSTFDDAAGDLAVRYLVPVGEEAHVQRTFGATPRMIAVLARLTGVDFPWARYDQVVVHDFIFGGMENTSCTTMTDVLLVDEKAAIEWDPESLVVHELAHQWFGDFVTCQDWSQGWLNESWATYCEALWYEADRDMVESVWHRWEAAEAYLVEVASRYRRPIVSYDFREPIDVFDRHLYEKGSLVLATLRTELGDDGFWAGLRHYLSTNAHRAVHTRDFQRAMEEATGRNLDRFVHQWIHSPGHPQLGVKLSHASGLLTVSVKQKQEGDGVPEAYHLPLRIVVVAADGTEQTVDLPVRERERTWALPVAEEPRCVRVDPGFRVLADLELEAPATWLAHLVLDACPSVAVRSARALDRADGGRAFAALVQGLSEHPYHGVRSRIAAMLGSRGGKAACDALLGALDNEPDPRVRRHVAQALGTFRESRVADALLAALDRAPETWHLQGYLLEALGRTRDPRAREAIEARFDTDSWADTVAQRGLHGLAFTEDPAVLGTLIARSRTECSPRQRAAAAFGLGVLADRVPKARQDAVDRLLQMVTEPGFREQLAAVAALGRAGDPRALGALDRLHRAAPDGRTRRYAYEAAVRVRRGRSTEEGLRTLRAQLDGLGEQNAKLRHRIEHLEGKDGTP